MIQIKNLNLELDGLSVLQSINVEIDDGEALVVLGPSGHGKSVLLKIIAGLMEPTSGQVDIDGKAPAHWVKEKSQVCLSMLFQKNAIFDSMTVFENVAFPLREKFGLNEDEISAAVSGALEEVGLAHAKNLLPDEISGGMQKRLGIARSLALKPKYLLYDDPTAGLDPITSRGIASLIRRSQKDHNMTIVSVTNDMARAKHLGDKFLFLYTNRGLLFDSFRALEESDHPAIYQFIRGLEEGPLRAVNA